MKALTLVVTILFSTIILKGQTPKIKVKKESYDTLKVLQGTWDFDFIQILNKPKSSETYYATELTIDKEKFIMRLSEAGKIGKLKTKNNIVTFVFDPGECDIDKSDTSWCKDMTIYYLTKNNLVLLKKQTKAEWYFTKQKGIQDVLFYYKR